MMAGIGFTSYQPMTMMITEDYSPEMNIYDTLDCRPYDNLQSQLVHLETDLDAIEATFIYTHWMTIFMTTVIIINALLSYSTPLGLYNFVLISSVSFMIISATFQSIVYNTLDKEIDVVCAHATKHQYDGHHLMDHTDNLVLFATSSLKNKYDFSLGECKLGQTAANIRGAFLYQFIGSFVSIVVFAVTNMGTTSTDSTFTLSQNQTNASELSMAGTQLTSVVKALWTNCCCLGRKNNPDDLVLGSDYEDYNDVGQDKKTEESEISSIVEQENEVIFDDINDEEQ